MTTIDTKALRALALAATPGPYATNIRTGALQGVTEVLLGCSRTEGDCKRPHEHDADFIVAAVNAVVPLCDEVERLRENLTAVQQRCNDLLTENRALRGVVSVKVVQLTPTATLPCYQTAGASGLDLHADLDLPVLIPAGGRKLVLTGIALAIPPGLEGQVRPRSGLGLRHGVQAALGTIDSDYRGNVGVVLFNSSVVPFQVEPGMRIAQLAIAPVARAELVKVVALGETERGVGGFGSTGA